MSEPLKIGDITITVADDEFANAFQTGYLRYKVDDQNKLLTDMDLYAFYVGTMIGVQHAGRYNAGYLTGWVAALLERKQPTVLVVSFTPSLTLRDVEVTVWVVPNNVGQPFAKSSRPPSAKPPHTNTLCSIVNRGGTTQRLRFDMGKQCIRPVVWWSTVPSVWTRITLCFLHLMLIRSLVPCIDKQKCRCHKQA